MHTRSGKKFDLTDSNTKDNADKLQVNQDYKYTEDDLKLVIPALLKNKGLILANENYGLVINPDQSLYKHNNNQILAISSPLSITEHKIADIQRLKQLELVIDNLIEKFSDHNFNNHKIIFPLNIEGNHWCLGTLDLILLSSCHQVKIVEVVSVYIYDSTQNKDYITQLKKHLHRILEKHLLPNKSLDLYITHKQLAVQPDVTSCGPITAYNLIKLISEDEKSFKRFDKYAYTQQKILELRNEQLRITADQDFMARQIANKPDIELSAREINGDIDYLSEVIREYRDSLSEQELNEFNNIAIEFIKIEQYSDADDVETERLRVTANLKEWFKQNQEKIALEVIKQFFKVDNLPTEIDKWQDNGKDTLCAVLENLYCSQDKQSDYVTPISVNQNNYNFIGHINEESLAESVGKEVTSKYGEYIGDFASGLKSGYGIDLYPVPGFEISTYFFGSRTDEGKFDFGYIGCFLGGKITELKEESYIVFRGWLDNGIINGLGELCLYSSGVKRYSLSARFDNGKLIKQYESEFPEDVHTLCMAHFAKYSNQFELYLDPGLQAELAMTRKRVLEQQAKFIDEETDDQSSSYSNPKRMRPSP